ncbi:MAG: hypothetical protein K2X70_09155 [Candidatus Obscuribacterales bacterium]|nr:hypothetical protein [Candidatus Obscuribacterales bacterium]
MQLVLHLALFIVAQMWSFAAATDFLANFDNDPTNDVCLEDVISLDPFVGGASHNDTCEAIHEIGILMQYISAFWPADIDETRSLDAFSLDLATLQGHALPNTFLQSFKFLLI